jgi:CRP-like cAMP-binding protein
VGIETDLLGCNGVRIETLGPGDVLGWSWILPPYELHYSARALEPTQAIALDGKALVARFEEDHDLGYEMMKRFAQVIAQRLAATRTRFMKVPDPTPARETYEAMGLLRPIHEEP